MPTASTQSSRLPSSCSARPRRRPRGCGASTATISPSSFEAAPRTVAGCPPRARRHGTAGAAARSFAPVSSSLLMIGRPWLRTGQPRSDSRRPARWSPSRCSRRIAQSSGQRRLAGSRSDRVYWKILESFTRSLVGVRRLEDGGIELRLSACPALLRFGPPELAVFEGSVSCRYSIRGGLSARRRGGAITFEQRIGDREVVLRSAITGFHPTLAARPGRPEWTGALYVQGQSRPPRRPQPSVLQASRGSAPCEGCRLRRHGTIGRALVPDSRASTRSSRCRAVHGTTSRACGGLPPTSRPATGSQRLWRAPTSRTTSCTRWARRISRPPTGKPPRTCARRGGGRPGADRLPRRARRRLAGSLGAPAQPPGDGRSPGRWKGAGHHAASGHGRRAG